MCIKAGRCLRPLIAYVQQSLGQPYASFVCYSPKCLLAHVPYVPQQPLELLSQLVSVHSAMDEWGAAEEALRRLESAAEELRRTAAAAAAAGAAASGTWLGDTLATRRLTDHATKVSAGFRGTNTLRSKRTLWLMKPFDASTVCMKLRTVPWRAVAIQIAPRTPHSHLDTCAPELAPRV